MSTSKETPGATQHENENEWEFSLCDCGNSVLHGYLLHIPTGAKIVGPYYSATSALEAMEDAIREGNIPEEERGSLTTQICNSEIPPEINEERGEGSVVFLVGSLEDLSALLLGQAMMDQGRGM